MRKYQVPCKNRTLGSLPRIDPNLSKLLLANRRSGIMLLRLELDYKVIRFLALAFYDASSCVIEPLV